MKETSDTHTGAPSHKNPHPVLTDSLASACEQLRTGNVVAIPTETVYGLAADATQDHAVAKIYSYKKRPRFNPLIVHVADLHQASHSVEITTQAKILAHHFWPGALTFVLPLKSTTSISLLCSAGLDTLAIRSPAHPMAQKLLNTLGKPLAAPSANPSTRLSPTSAAHVVDGFQGQDLMVLDGGECILGLESTIVDLSTETPAILRYGSVTKKQIEEVLDTPCLDPTDSEGVKSPGQMLRHYAPSKPLRLNAKNPKADEGYLGFSTHAHGPFNLSPTGNLEEAAANLFKMLHLLDKGPCTAIAVAPLPTDGIGRALNDRLKRATHQDT